MHSEAGIPFLDLTIPVFIQAKSAVFQCTLGEIETSLGKEFCEQPANSVGREDNHNRHIVASLARGPNNLSDWLRQVRSVLSVEQLTHLNITSDLDVKSLLGLTDETKVAIKVIPFDSVQAHPEPFGTPHSPCACIACECNVHRSAPQLSEFAALKCLLMRRLTGQIHSSLMNHTQRTANKTSCHSDEILRCVFSPLAYYPYPIPLGVARFTMPTKKFKGGATSSSPSCKPEAEAAPAVQQQEVIGLFQIYKKACSLDRLFYRFPRGFDLASDRELLQPKSPSSDHFIGTSFLLNQWSKQLMALLDDLHTPSPIFPFHNVQDNLISQSTFTSSAVAVVHKDLKLPNILVDSLGRIHLVDFGCATVIPCEGETTKVFSDTRCDITAHNALRQPVGTRSTMAPELRFPQSSGREAHCANPQVLVREGSLFDVFGMGVVLAELVSGSPVNEKGTISASDVAKATEDLLSRIPAQASHYATDLIELVRVMVEVQPSTREQKCSTSRDVTQSKSSATNIAIQSGHANEKAKVLSLAASLLNQSCNPPFDDAALYPAAFFPVMAMTGDVESRLEAAVGDAWPNITKGTGLGAETEEEVGEQTLGL